MTRLRVATSDTFRSLRVRNFRLFFSGQLISQTGTWLSMVAQVLLVLDMTDSGIALGLLTVCMFGPVLVLGAWAGTVADRSDKRRLLFRVQALAMAQSIVLGVVVLTGSASVGVVYALAVVQGVLTAFDNPARRAFVVEMVPTDDVANAVSLNSAVMTGSRVVGPALAGLLVVTVGYGWAFVLDGVSYLAVLAGLALMRPAELHPSVPAVRGRGQVRDGIAYAHRTRSIWVPLVMMAIIGTLAFNFQVTVPLLVQRTLHGGDGTFTLLFSVLSFGSLVGALATARRREVTPQHVVGAAAAFGVTMLGLALAPGLGWAFAVAVPLGVASIFFMTSSTAVVQLRADPVYRGRVLALQAIVFLGSTPIGGPIVGWVAEEAGPRVAVSVGAVGCFVAAAWGHWALRRAEPDDATVVDLHEPAAATAAAEAAAEAPISLAD